MRGILAEPIDMMSVITDRSQRKSEAIDVDQVFVMAFTPSHVLRSVEYIVSFGGLDSRGRLHATPDGQLTRVTLGTDIYNQLFLDADGNPLREFSRGLLDTIFVQHVIPTCNALVWKMKDLVISMDGTVIYDARIFTSEAKRA